MKPRDIKWLAVAGVIVAAVGLFAWQRDPVATPSGANAPAAQVPASGRGTPPAAYIEFGNPGRWLDQGSSCWTSGTSMGCADAAAPGRLQGLPTVVVSRGAVGRIHLGFSADDAHISIGGKELPSTGSRTITFTASRAGIVEIFGKHGNNDASYYGRVAFASLATPSTRWKRFSDPTLSFRYPSTWRRYTWTFDSSFSTALVYLSTAKEHDPCVTHTTKESESIRCGAALDRLEPAGVLLTWTAWGFPGRNYRTFPGQHTRIGGRPARVQVGPPDPGCAHIGGETSVTAAVARPNAPYNWMEMDACLRGPKPGAGLAEVKAMLASTQWRQ